MDNYKKYLKYKNKYLLLKYGGSHQNRKLYVQTILNNGSAENMTNQCFWISILQFLKKNLNFSDLTLKTLRETIGRLDKSSRHTLFDSNDPIFRHAASLVAEIFDLTITIYPVNSNGKILYNGNLIDKIGNGINKVNIAQFGIYHFQLIKHFINNNKDSEFIPAVVVNGNLKFDNNNIDSNKIKLEILIIDLKSDINDYKNTLNELDDNLKDMNIMYQYSDDLNLYNQILSTTDLINEITQKLKKTEQELSTYNLLLSEI